MPKSKRNKEVELSKTKKRGMEWKKQLFTQIRSCVDSYSNVYVFSVNDMRNNKMKSVRDQWKDSRFFIGKNKIISMALGRSTEEEYKNNLHKIGRQLKGERGLLFSSKSVDEVLNWFRAYSEGDFARSGHIATEDVTLKIGPLSMFPHNLEPYLRQLGLPTTLVKGVIHLIKDHEVCKKGDKLTPETAKILKLLGYEMAEFRITIECMWSDDGSFIQFTENPNADGKENVKKRKSKSKRNKNSSVNVEEMEVVEPQNEGIITDTNTNQIDDEEFSKDDANDLNNENEVTSNDLTPNNIFSAKENVKKRKSKSKHNGSSINVEEMEMVEPQNQGAVTDANSNQIVNEVIFKDLTPNDISSAKKSAKKRKSKLKQNESSIDVREMEVVEPQNQGVVTDAISNHIVNEVIFKDLTLNSSATKSAKKCKSKLKQNESSIDVREMEVVEPQNQGVVTDANSNQIVNEVIFKDLTSNDISSAKKSAKKQKSKLKNNESSIDVKEMEAVEQKNLDVADANSNQIAEKECGKDDVGNKEAKNRDVEESVKKQKSKSKNIRDSFINVKGTEGIEPQQDIITDTNSNQIADEEFSKNAADNSISAKGNVKKRKSKSKHNDSSNLATVENLSDKEGTKNSEIVELNKRQSTDRFSSSIKISNNDLFNISTDLNDNNIHPTDIASDEKSINDNKVLSSTPSARVAIGSNDKPIGLEIETPVSKCPKKNIQDVEENINEINEATEKDSEHLSRSRKRKIIKKAKQEAKLMKTPESANTSQDSPIFRELRNRSVKVSRKRAK